MDQDVDNTPFGRRFAPHHQPLESLSLQPEPPTKPAFQGCHDYGSTEVIHLGK
jgi:hypothetical protein